MLPPSIRQSFTKNPHGWCVFAMATIGLRLDPIPTVRTRLHREFGLYSGDGDEPFCEELFHGKSVQTVSIFMLGGGSSWATMRAQRGQPG